MKSLTCSQLAHKIRCVPVFSNDAFSVSVIDTIMMGRLTIRDDKCVSNPFVGHDRKVTTPRIILDEALDMEEDI